MLLQDQLLLDQLPMDILGAVNEELETEFREYGDAVRQGMEEKQAVHKQEIQEQVAHTRQPYAV